jgi:hypothetical protein
MLYIVTSLLVSSKTIVLFFQTRRKIMQNLKRNLAKLTLCTLAAACFIPAYADTFSTQSTASNFLQLNLDPAASSSNVAYFSCTVDAGSNPHLTNNSSSPAQTGVLNPDEKVYFVNYASMVSGFSKNGLLSLPVSKVNKYAFAYYYDARLANQTPSVQIFVSRAGYTIDCQAGNSNRPIYKASKFG